MTKASPTHTGHGATPGDGRAGCGTRVARGAGRGSRAGTTGGGARSVAARKPSGST